MGFYSFYKIVKDALQTIFGRKFFKYILIILGALMLIGAFSKVSYGASIENSYINDDGKQVIDYEYHKEKNIVKGSIVLPDKDSFSSYILTFHNSYDTPYLLTPRDTLASPYFYYDCSNSLNTYANEYLYLRDGLNTSKRGFSVYKYDTNTNSFNLATSSATNYLSHSPSFLYAYNCEVGVLIDKTNNISYPIHQTNFIPTEPTVEVLSDTQYKVCLNGFWNSYVCSDANIHSNVSNTTVGYFKFNVYDLSSDNPDYYYTYNINSLSNYINDGYLDIPLQEFITEYGNNFSFIKEHEYKFELQINATFTININDTNYTYQSLYETSLSNTHTFGTGTSIQPGNWSDTEEGKTQTEQLETSKGIWGTIKEILSYLNPFSENFFGYKIVDLIISGFQILFDTVSNMFESISNFITSFFSNDYDEGNISIDTSSSDNVSDSNYTNFITALIESVNEAVTGDWSTVEEVEIPFGIVEGHITYRSDMVSAHIPNALKLLINTFWMFIFGMYIFKFGLNLVSWLKSGQILEGSGFTQDEVITSSML